MKARPSERKKSTAIQQHPSESEAAVPVALNPGGFNPDAMLPYGLTCDQVQKSMNEFLTFLGFINGQLCTKRIPRLESFMMAANFSSLVGEFMGASIPKFCPTLAKNRHHNGHPDLLPAGRFPRNAKPYASEGIEIKASRYERGWQGHNAEDVWLMVFVFESNTSQLDPKTGMVQEPRSFRFLKVVGARVTKDDWRFSGRSKTSRRTITASVTRDGFLKMEANWIYRHTGALPPED